MGPFERQVEQSLKEGVLNVRPFVMRSVQTPRGYKLMYTGKFERFPGRESKMDHDIYSLMDREGEVAIIRDANYGDRFHADLSPFRARHRDVFRGMRRIQFAADRGPSGDGSLQAAVDDAVKQIELAKEKINEM